MTGKSRELTDNYRVFLYKLLYNAPSPMTFDEIVKEMMVPLGHFSRACVEYREHVGAKELDERGKDEAKKWWVESLLVQAKGNARMPNPLFICKSAETGGPIRQGHPIPYRSPMRVWAANPANPPWVSDDRIVRQDVRWTPEFGSLGVKMAAGSRYLADLAAYRAKHPKLGDDLAKLLEAAEQAIRNNPASQSTPGA